ncbi:MAG: carboxypeptidase regulatory-like domain-containing protein, partial [Acidobacteriota bacterium]
GYTFSPTNLAVTISGANQTGKNFTATANPSGDTALTSGLGVSTGSIAKGAWKYYTIAVPSGATNLSITLTGLSADLDLYVNNSTTHPTTSSYYGRSWNSGTTSESLSYTSPTVATWCIGVYGYAAGSGTVTATVTTGTATYSISGTVTLSTGGGLSGVTVTAGSASATTSSTGAYTISGLANGTYTVTPGKSGYTFSPASTSVTISGDNKTGIDFTGTASGGATSNRLSDGDFEGGLYGSSTTGTSGTTGPWSWTSTGSNNPILSDSTKSHAGSWLAWLNGYGSTETDTLTQSAAIPSNATTATLSFYLMVSTSETTTTSAYDKLTVILIDGAGTSHTLATYSNLNKSTSYSQKSFNVLTYKGQTVKIQFKGAEDSSLATNFYIDDAALMADGN